MLVVISAPSGAGKTTLAHSLMRQYPNIRISISHTTRNPRPGDENEVDYYFVDDAGFDQMVADNAFLEWAHVHDNRYGTSHAEVERLRSLGFDVLFDVDYQGGISIMEAHGDAISIFILPPSCAELEKRIRRRGTDTPDTIDRRLANAAHEMKQYRHYHYTIINDHLEESVKTLNAIYSTQLHKTSRMAEQATAIVDGSGPDTTA
jgi:guanylate kinase